MKKQGISLVVLVITIIVMIIIASIAIIGINDLIITADTQDFANEVNVIEESIKEYYATHKILPVTSTKYNKSELLDKLDGSYKTKLNTEITENNDTDNTFYVVDLKLLEITTPERGLEVDALDVYLVASNTLNVYYLKGVEIEDNIYFSNKELIDKKKVEDNVVTSNEQDVNLKSSIIVTKSTNAWTNNLDIKVDYVLNSGESISYAINNKEEKTLTGNNITLNVDTLTASEISSLSNASKLVVYRKSSGTTLETKEIDISNLDVVAPVVNSVGISSGTSSNTLTLDITESLSGIKAVYFEYLTYMYDEQNNITKDIYTSISDVTKNYLLSNGKVTYTNKISMSNSIASIKYMVVDNAGNTTDVIEYRLPDGWAIQGAW